MKPDTDTPLTSTLERMQHIRISGSSNDPADLLREALNEMAKHAGMLEIAMNKARQEYLDQCCETAEVREERDCYKHQAMAAHTFIGELSNNIGLPSIRAKCESFIATAIAANA